MAEERLRLRINQDEMARVGGVSKRTYCYYESGEREPCVGFLTAIAAAGADVQYIITGQRSEGGGVPDRGLRGFPEFGAEDVLEVVGLVMERFRADGKSIPPRAKLMEMIRLTCEVLAEEERKEKLEKQ